VSQACEGNICVSCADGSQNQDESDVDCGGAACGTCDDTSSCNDPADCASASCVAGVCAAARCDDSVRNQDETGVDCGGGTCAACASGSGCSSPSDCNSLVCDNAICQAASCSDTVLNQDETDTDCGGSTCGPCGPASSCSAPSDCASQVCLGSVCQAATCADGVLNQDETSVDCGGATCAPCPCTFGTPQLLGNPNAFGSHVWAPTLSSDGLTMYLSLTSSGFNERVAITTRPSRGNNFGSVSALPFPVNSNIEGTPELSQDGLSLYFYSEGFGGAASRDLYVATRASTAAPFSAVTQLITLNSPQRDDRPWVSPDELTVYFSSQRASFTDDLWRATRNTRSDAFGTPVVVTELNSSGNDAGIFLTADGKTALLASDRPGSFGVDLYRAVRASTSGPFSTPQRLSEVSSIADDIDPQLTADGQELFFASTRNGGNYQMFRSLVTCP
jgi:hypothetical protein